nr:MAG TPA: hypothetical protein [Caudoviricetes sp.]
MWATGIPTTIKPTMHHIQCAWWAFIKQQRQWKKPTI